jgi:hypothetical protein
MNMRDYPTLHLDTNLNKGTVYSKKEYGCKWTWERLSNITLSNEVKSVNVWILSGVIYCGDNVVLLLMY